MSVFYALVLLIALPSRVDGVPFFMGLGSLPGSPDNPAAALSQAHDISRDGQVVVGLAQNADGKHEAFRWTLLDGMVGLGDLPGGDFNSVARGVSRNGSVVVGRSLGTGQAFRWTEVDGLTPLQNAPGATGSTALRVSADGSVIAGNSFFGGSTPEATKWTNGTPELLAESAQNTRAMAVSADGSIVVGESGLEGSVPKSQVTRWTAADGEIRMGVEGDAFEISADRTVIVGWAILDGFEEAFRWEAAVFQGLGLVDDGAVNDFSRATDVSADGSVIVGFSTAGSGIETFIWDSVNGMRALKNVLESDFGLDLAGWQFNQSGAVISDNGLTIAGSALNPSGDEEAWVAVIPEPSTAMLLAAGLGALAARRCRLNGFG